VLGAALDGIRAVADLPVTATSNPADVEGVATLPSDLAPALGAFESSDGPQRVLGDKIVQAVLAVRRWDVSGFDSQLGRAVRRWCAPLPNLDRHASPTRTGPAGPSWQRWR
jgi:glutamine synthetase